MWIEKALLKLSNENTYNREDLFRIFLSEKPDLGEGAFRWTLYDLLQKQRLFRVGYDTYAVEKPKQLQAYRPYYSNNAKKLMQSLVHNYPNMNFVMFESVLLNEFLNHQIAQNTIYIQVEKEVSSYIFEELQDKYQGSVLYNPGKVEFERYWTPDCIVILDLISQSPLSLTYPHEIIIEKMLVDIVAEKSIAATYSPSEISFVFENVIKNYQVDLHKMNRYASRRGKVSQVQEYAGG